jgi:hypothetical protein
MVFNYYKPDNGNAENLMDLFRQNNIDYVCYDDFHYYKFVVRRCGKKWDDIMVLVNSISATKYNFESINFRLTDENRPTGVCGNIQEIVNW